MSKAGFAWMTRVCVFCVLSAAAVVSPAQQVDTLANFNGGNGANPLYVTLVQGTDGELYGTTSNGGARGATLGSVFKVATPTGTLTTLHSFADLDGAFPYAGLVLATDGNFYGTTSAGGAVGNGTLFKITRGGALTTLHSFDYADGNAPSGALVQATDGNFYGTTSEGGLTNRYCFAESCGTVFKITPGGTLTTLYKFCAQTNCTDGDYPNAGLIQASDGNLYGTTEYGGARGYTCTSGCGTIFKITPDGALTTLESFGFTDGANPAAPLIQATDGNFYGTTVGGANIACSIGCGTVFEITPEGTLTTLHRFNFTDGDAPFGGLLQATDGNFYGTTSAGYASFGTCTLGCGTVFEITPEGTLTTLLGFNVTDGANPFGGVAEGTNGTLYGTTSQGGANNDGTIFYLAIGLHPFIETVPTSGREGQPVKILGTNLTGATSVTFNRTAATFTVVSSSSIATTVPSGATTGTVQVVTPSGALTSNVVFQVKP